MNALHKPFRVLMILFLLAGVLGEAPFAMRSRTAAAAAPASTSTAELVVYDDALAPGWQDWSWNSTISLANPAPVLSGQASIAVTFNAPYAGFSVRTAPPLQTADFTAVSFFVYAPNTDRSLRLVLQSADDGGLSEAFSFNAPANMWSQIVVDMESLGSPSALARINIGDNSGASQPVFYLDQITLLTSASSAPGDIPAVIPGAPRPTLNLSAASGYATQNITARGQAPPGLGPESSVRLAWLFDEATYTASQVSLNPGGSYSASLTIPLGAPEGPAQVCAALTGLPNAAFTCATFNVDPPPPAQVSGTLDAALVSPGMNATVHLLDAGGTTLYSAPVTAGGSFNLGAIPPGRYAATVSGVLPRQAATSTFDARAATSVSLNLAAFLPDGQYNPVDNVACTPANTQASADTVKAAVTDLGLIAAGDPGLGLYAARDSELAPMAASNFSVRFPLQVAQHSLLFRKDFGTFISGVTLNNEFSARVSRTSESIAVQKVEYWVTTPGSTQPVKIGESASAQDEFKISYNVGSLPPGKSKLFVFPVVGGQRQCPAVKEITVIADPTASPKMRQLSPTTWNAAAKTYRFSASIPNVGGLPLAHPSTPTNLPYLGNIQSKLSAGIRIDGTMKLSGVVHLTLMQASAEATVFGRNLYNSTQDLSPSKNGFYPGENFASLKNVSISRSRSLWSARYEQTVFNAVLFSFLGIVNVGMTVKIGLSGEVMMHAIIYPFQPNLDLTLTPSVAVDLVVSVWVNILVLASAGADAIPSVHLAIPLRVNTGVTNRSPVWLESPCLGVRVDIRLWVQVNYIFDKWRKSTTFNVLKTDTPAGCIFATQVAEQLIEQAQINALLAPPEPRVMASPDVVSNVHGRMLSVYVEDLTPNAEQPTPAVMARFKEPNSSQWSAPVQLSSGQAAVNDPAAAFFGSDMSQAMVAWAQTDITAQEEEAAQTHADLMNHMEIYVNRWNGTSWSGPTPLTADLLGDGAPALAGGPFGVSLAWVRDMDGNSATQADMVIARRSFSTTTGQWAPVQTFQAAPSGMNAQVSISRQHYGDSAVEAMAWIYDADGSPATLEDRRVHVAILAGGDWVMLNPQPLPPRLASVSIAADPGNGQMLHLAFTTYNTVEDGTSGAITDDTRLWTAKINTDTTPYSVDYFPVNDERGGSVRAERPRLQAAANGEFVLTFRRFGDIGTTGQLGQAAVSRIGDPGDEIYSPPVYLTGGLNQHWQAAAAVNLNSGRLELLAVQRPPLNPAALQALGGFDPGYAGIIPSAELSPAVLAAGAERVSLVRSLQADPSAHPQGEASLMTLQAVDPVIALSFSDEGDPALEPQMSLSKAHAAPGSSVTATVTVRNLGRSESAARLRFFRGLPGSGDQVAEINLGLLDVGELREISHSYTVQGGEEPIYAEISALDGHGDASPANNIATARLGALPAPEVASVRISPVFENSLEVTILPSEAEAVSGYRILRSQVPGGLYELAGETTGDLYFDLLLDLGSPYCYVAQAYDRAGVLSPYSGEVCTLLPLREVFLPSVRR
jgi:hypothetical protein